MREQRIFVKSLTFKHKRQSKVREAVAGFWGKVVRKLTSPIKVGAACVKKIKVEYEAPDDALVKEFSDIPEKKQQQFPKTDKGEGMVERLRETYKL